MRSDVATIGEISLVGIFELNSVVSVPIRGSRQLRQSWLGCLVVRMLDSRLVVKAGSHRCRVAGKHCVIPYGM